LHGAVFSAVNRAVVVRFAFWTTTACILVAVVASVL
jgi:hypothetical protein